jgi:predicted metal-dependent HD superfamily phosphohydrolase
VNALRADLTQRWQRVEQRLPGSAAIGIGLIESWAQPQRRYHDLTHLQNVLVGVDELASWADDAFAVELGAWYHDAVYDGAAQAEERSALRAEVELGALGLPSETVAEVARLVRLTAGHDPAPEDRNGSVLCDADLAILAADAERYATYAAAVRQEYAHVEESAFRAGRAAILGELLARRRLFRTPIGQDRWERRARANLAAEIAALGS